MNENDTLKNIEAFSLKLYGDFAPVRQFILEHPEMKVEIVEVIGRILNCEMSEPFFVGPDAKANVKGL